MRSQSTHRPDKPAVLKVCGFHLSFILYIILHVPFLMYKKIRDQLLKQIMFFWLHLYIQAFETHESFEMRSGGFLCDLGWHEGCSGNHLANGILTRKYIN